MRASHGMDGKWKLHCSAALVVAVFFCFSRPGRAGESKAASNALLRAASAPATNALTTFRVKPGFRLDRVGGGESSGGLTGRNRSEEHTSELQSLRHLVCR